MLRKRAAVAKGDVKLFDSPEVELLRCLEELAGTLELRHCPAEGAQRLFEDVLSEVAGAIALLILLRVASGPQVPFGASIREVTVDAAGAVARRARPRGARP